MLLVVVRHAEWDVGFFLLTFSAGLQPAFFGSGCLGLRPRLK